MITYDSTTTTNQPLDKNKFIESIANIIDWLYSDSKHSTEPYYYCLQLHSYSSIILHSGSSDYMTTHYFPFVEIIIDPNTRQHNIIDILWDSYCNLCSYNYDQLDKIPL